MYPASLTKMLVSVVMLENTQDLENEKIVMTNTAMNCILGTGASVLGLKIGEELTADQALHALLISSGGDVAYAIAEHYGGSVDGFMTMMNETAQKIGMTASHFGNPVGLHDEQTYTTPYDISLLAKYARILRILLMLLHLRVIPCRQPINLPQGQYPQPIF